MGEKSFIRILGLRNVIDQMKTIKYFHFIQVK